MMDPAHMFAKISCRSAGASEQGAVTRSLERAVQYLSLSSALGIRMDQSAEASDAGAKRIRINDVAVRNLGKGVLELRLELVDGERDFGLVQRAHELVLAGEAAAFLAEIDLAELEFGLDEIRIGLELDERLLALDGAR